MPTWVCLHIEGVHQAQRLPLQVIQPGGHQLVGHRIPHSRRAVVQPAADEQRGVLCGHVCQAHALSQRQVSNLAHLQEAQQAQQAGQWGSTQVLRYRHT